LDLFGLEKNPMAGFFVIVMSFWNSQNAGNLQNTGASISF